MLQGLHLFLHFFCSRSAGRGNFEVVLGAHNIHQDEKSQQRIKVLKYIQHPKYQSDNTEDISYDIMLLKVFFFHLCDYIMRFACSL